MVSRSEAVLRRLLKAMENGLYDSSIDPNSAAYTLITDSATRYFQYRLYLLVRALIRLWALGDPNDPELSEVHRWAREVEK